MLTDSELEDLAMAVGDGSLDAADRLDAFNRLHDHFARRVLGFMKSAVGPTDASDASQECWQSVYVSLHEGKYVSCGKLGPWILKIARNKGLDVIRHRKGRVNLDDVPECAAAEDSPLKALIVSEHSSGVHKCLAELADTDPKLSAALRLSLGGSDTPHIAEELSVTPAYALTLLSRARGKIKTCVERSNLQ